MSTNRANGVIDFVVGLWSVVPDREQEPYQQWGSELFKRSYAQPIISAVSFGKKRNMKELRAEIHATLLRMSNE